MKTETVAIDSISLDPANVRRHPDRNIQTIVASLKRFGQQKPIVVTKEGIVIAGNGTLQAARHLGWKQIEIVRTGLTGSDATAYAIADNRTAELAEWDDDALAQTLAALQIEDEQLATQTGFAIDEIEKMTGAFDIDTCADPELDSGDKEPFQQMSFVLHDSQASTVQDAIDAAIEKNLGSNPQNKNRNGNAIYAICTQWLASIRS